MMTAFVTGGGKGLGKGFVDYLLDRGYVVFSGERQPQNTPQRENLHVIPLDLSSDTSIAQSFELVSVQTDHLDFLVNNAGVNKDSATNNHKEKVTLLQDLDRESLLNMISINTIAPLLMVKTYLPLLMKAEKSFVVNVSSCRASYHDEIPNTSANYGYRASKTALNMMTFCSLTDLPTNIKTYAVHPGSVKTDMNPVGTDMPYDQAQKILAIAQNWKDEFNGKFLRYDGTLYPL